VTYVVGRVSYIGSNQLDLSHICTVAAAAAAGGMKVWDFIN
jgi:hypothetical protein